MQPGLRKQLDEEGYVILRGLVEPQVVAAARSDIDGLVDELAAGLIREGEVQSSFSEESFADALLIGQSFQLLPVGP